MLVSSKIFRSRWSALIWAGGIIWTAYDVASANTPSAHRPSGSANAASGQQADQKNAADTGSDDAQAAAVLANFVAGN